MTKITKINIISSRTNKNSKKLSVKFMFHYENYAQVYTTCKN